MKNQIKSLLQNQSLASHEIADTLNIPRKELSRILAELTAAGEVKKIPRYHAVKIGLGSNMATLYTTHENYNNSSVNGFNKFRYVGNPLRVDNLNIVGEVRTIENLRHNTAKGIMGKRSAFIGNSLETMSF